MEDGAIGPVYQRANAVLEKDYVENIAEHLVGAEYSYKWTSIKE